MKKHSVLAALFVFLVTFFVYRGATRHEFVMLDDHTHLVENEALNPPTLKGIAGLWKAPYKGLYIPLTYSLWGMEKLLAQKYPKQESQIFHTTNVITHSLNAVLVLLILGLLGLNSLPALLGSLLFSLHPVQVESVAWVSGFKDLSSGFFFLFALYLALKAAKQSSFLLYGLALTACLFSLFCKPSAVVLAPMLLIFLNTSMGFSFRRAVIWSVPFFVAAIPFLILTRLSQPEKEMLYVTPLWARPLVAADTWIFYVSKLLLPFQLAPDYSRSPQHLLAHAWRYVAPVAAVLIALRISRASKTWRMGVLLFTIALLPVLGLVPFFFQFFSTVADRYLYLALIGPAWLVASLLQTSSHRIFSRSLATASLVGLSVLSLKQVPVWKSDLSLFSHAAKINPHSLLARNNLGSILEREGRVQEAAEQYWEAARIAPDSPPALYNLGRTLGLLGRYKEAVWPLEDLLKLTPGLPDGHYVLGFVYLKQGELERAKIHLSYATQLNPLDARAHYHLGEIFAKEGHWKSAWKSYQQAIALNPLHEEAKKGAAIASHNLDQLDKI